MNIRDANMKSPVVRLGKSLCHCSDNHCFDFLQFKSVERGHLLAVEYLIHVGAELDIKVCQTLVFYVLRSNVLWLFMHNAVIIFEVS